MFEKGGRSWREEGDRGPGWNCGCITQRRSGFSVGGGVEEDEGEIDGQRAEGGPCVVQSSSRWLVFMTSLCSVVLGVGWRRQRIDGRADGRADE
jgi:hypothetical protein